MTIAAFTLAALAFVGFIVIGLRLRAVSRRDHRRNGDNGFKAWDWPPRPINGHDHPEPPELEREPTA
jgi:hypothetical protein